MPFSAQGVLVTWVYRWFVVHKFEVVRLLAAGFQDRSQTFGITEHHQHAFPKKMYAHSRIWLDTLDTSYEFQPTNIT